MKMRVFKTLYFGGIIMKKVILCVLVGLITLATGWYTSFAVGRLGGLMISNILNNETKTEETD